MHGFDLPCDFCASCMQSCIARRDQRRAGSCDLPGPLESPALNSSPSVGNRFRKPTNLLLLSAGNGSRQPPMSFGPGHARGTVLFPVSSGLPVARVRRSHWQSAAVTDSQPQVCKLEPASERGAGLRRNRGAMPARVPCCPWLLADRGLLSEAKPRTNAGACMSFLAPRQRPRKGETINP